MLQSSKFLLITLACLPAVSYAKCSHGNVVGMGKCCCTCQGAKYKVRKGLFKKRKRSKACEGHYLTANCDPDCDACPCNKRAKARVQVDVAGVWKCFICDTESSSRDYSYTRRFPYTDAKKFKAIGAYISSGKRLSMGKCSVCKYEKYWHSKKCAEGQCHHNCNFQEPSDERTTCEGCRGPWVGKDKCDDKCRCTCETCTGRSPRKSVPFMVLSGMLSVPEIARKKQTFPKATRTLEEFEELVNSQNQEQITELCKSQHYIENSAANLMKTLGASDTGRLTKLQMRPLCEKVIKNGAGAAWHVLPWGTIHGHCDNIGNKSDRNEDNAIDLFEFQIFYRSTLLFLCGAVSKEGAEKISDRAWEAQEIDYDIVSVDQCR